MRQGTLLFLLVVLLWIVGSSLGVLPRLWGRTPPTPAGLGVRGPRDPLPILVEDSGCSPVRDATVTVHWPGRPAPETLAADSCPGSFTLRLPADAASFAGVQVTASIGHLVAKQTLTANPGGGVGMTLPGTFCLNGRVVSKATGRPLAGFEVRSDKTHVLTDAEGAFHLGIHPHRGALDGSLRIQVGRPGANPHRFPLTPTDSVTDVLYSVEE